MGTQLPLQLVHTLRYSSRTFLVHQGVANVVASLETLSYQRVFSLSYVQGPPRSGKTHLGVYLVGHLQEKKRPARMYSREDLTTSSPSGLRGMKFKNGETVVLDDGDLLLAELSARNQSGVFMDLTEELGRVDGTLIILGSCAPESIECSRQIRSRLNSGLHLVLEGPAESELDPLLRVITKQRGLQLSESKRSYVLRRVARTLPALVECIEKVEDTSDFSVPRTSFTALADAVAKEPSGAPLFEQDDAFAGKTR